MKNETLLEENDRRTIALFEIENEDNSTKDYEVYAGFCWRECIGYFDNLEDAKSFYKEESKHW